MKVVKKIEEKVEIDEKNMAVTNAILEEGFVYEVGRKKYNSNPENANQVIFQLLYIAWSEGYLKDGAENMYWEMDKRNKERNSNGNV